MEDVGLRDGFWKDRRVLVTGHTGFKGAWLGLWLQRLGSRVTGIALPPDRDAAAFPSLAPWDGLESHMADIRNDHEVRDIFARARPEVVFHLAAQAIVRQGYEDPRGTYETNVLGTFHLLEACEVQPDLKAVVVVTTDKVYRPGPPSKAFRESDPLGGSDPYSTSKACAELLVEERRRLTSLPVATARAGNVLGGGDDAPDRLLPDLVRSVLADVPVKLRRPDAIRPWQFVLDPLYGYLLLAQLLAQRPDQVPGAVNFGPPVGSTLKVSEVIELALRAWGRGSWEPLKGETYAENEVLELDPTLAQSVLGWSTRLDIETAVKWAIAWYQKQRVGEDMRRFTLDQITEFEDLLG